MYPPLLRVVYRFVPFFLVVAANPSLIDSRPLSERVYARFLRVLEGADHCSVD